MIKIRRSTFETNSSSTHSITMCYESDFEKFKKGELFYDCDSGKLVDKEERKRILKENFMYSNSEYEDGVYHFRGKTFTWRKIDKELYDLISDDDLQKFEEECDFYNELPQTYEEWLESEYLETYKDEFVIDGGQKIIAFGKYGYNG